MNAAATSPARTLPGRQLGASATSMPAATKEIAGE
jgi:hypothetical protein